MAAIDEIFTPAVLTELAAVANRSDELTERLAILKARGSDAGRRALRAAWEAYLEGAAACGLFEEPGGVDLTKRLIDREAPNFRSAITECMACWLLAAKFRHQVTRTDTSGADFLVHATNCYPPLDLNLEVKAPVGPASPTSGSFAVTLGHTILAKTVDDANRQFPKNAPNVLFLAPWRLSEPYGPRYELLQAFVAEEKIVFRLNKEKGRLEGDPFIGYTDGRFTRYDKGKGAPRFTRVGAVVYARETSGAGSRLASVSAPWVDHELFVLHNPNASRPIPTEVFAGVPQFVQRDGDLWGWTDDALLWS